MERKINCWEFNKCGREPEGENSKEFGACPTKLTSEFDGVNGGKNGGRSCWTVEGTLCNGEVQGAIGSKLMDCIHCEFLKYVNEEEGREFVLIPKKSFYE